MRLKKTGQIPGKILNVSQNGALKSAPFLFYNNTYSRYYGR